jgi:nucleoid DNA-binding protein
MRKTQLTGKLARHSGVTRAQAADRLDRVVHDILLNLRKGRAAELPGLGQFHPGKPWKFEFEKDRNAGK